MTASEVKKIVDGKEVLVKVGEYDLLQGMCEFSCTDIFLGVFQPELKISQKNTGLEWTIPINAMDGPPRQYFEGDPIVIDLKYSIDL